MQLSHLVYLASRRGDKWYVVQEIAAIYMLIDARVFLNAIYGLSVQNPKLFRSLGVGAQSRTSLQK